MNEPKGHCVVGHEAATPRVAVARCFWCGGRFTTRRTGGSEQKFCSPGHRQAFWIAARRWTMQAIEMGLLSVDALKAPQTGVHADNGPVQSG